MAILPATAQSVGQGFERTYSTRPSPWESAFMGLSSIMGGMAQKKKAEQGQLAALLPALIQMRQASPGIPGEEGNLNVGGMPWNITSPVDDYSRMMQEGKWRDYMTKRAAGITSLDEMLLGSWITEMKKQEELRPFLEKQGIDVPKLDYKKFRQSVLGGLGKAPGEKDKMIRVKRKSDGLPGSLPESEFDSKLYERI